MRIVLLGDIHVFQLMPAPWHWLSKRILGQTNLLLNRRSRFDLTRLPDVFRHAVELNPDCILHTGDWTTTALSAEFEMARQLIGTIPANIPFITIPGNHDRYTFTAARTRRFENALAPFAPQQYPHHRDLGDGIHLLALDATRPTLMHAHGRCGDEQLAKLRDHLTALSNARHIIVMNHYPLTSPTTRKPEGYFHRLRDAAKLRDILTDFRRTFHGAMLYVHGHVHSPWACPVPDTLVSGTGIIDINAGAPVMRDADYPDGQGFWQLDFNDANWSLARHVPHPAGQWQTAPHP